MTPEDILKKVTCNWMRELVELRAVQAMEEYAQQEAEMFAEWTEENNWFKAVGKDIWICLATDEEFTISELYQEYLKRKEKLCQ